MAGLYGAVSCLPGRRSGLVEVDVAVALVLVAVSVSVAGVASMRLVSAAEEARRAEAAVAAAAYEASAVRSGQPGQPGVWEEVAPGVEVIRDPFVLSGGEGGVAVTVRVRSPDGRTVLERTLWELVR